MLKKIFLGLLVIVGLVVGYASTKPDSFRYERNLTMKAPPEKIQPHVDDFHAWTAWSPWENIDPNLKRSYGGAEKGKGATYAWEGNDEVGAGAMEILESSPSKILIQLDFKKPFEAHNTAEFTMTPEGDGTKVTWAMYGPQPLISKVMGLFVDMDKMLGAQFQSGLEKLKVQAEK